MQLKNKVIVIAGLTASGKTKLAIDLAKKINGEIINADSRSIYKGMDIGTGKPKLQLAVGPTTPKLRGVNFQRSAGYLVKGIPHHLFNIKNPDESFNVAEFKKLAKEKIKEIRSRNHIPIIVGGTGLYIDALIYDYKLPKAKPSKEIRKKLEEKRTEELFKELKKADPKTAATIDPKNKRRIIRALEIYYQTKESKALQEKKKKLPKNVLYFAIDIPREELYKKINKRVRDMFIVQKLDYEVKKLLKNYSSKLPIMQTMGYRETIQYLNKELSFEEAIEKTQQAHRNFAKRQLTWFRRNKDIFWIKPNIQEVLSRIDFQLFSK